MSSFNNQVGGHPYLGESNSLHLKTGMGTSSALADAALQQPDVKPTWTNLLAAAKVAYNHGYKDDAVQLYKAGLIEASRTMDQREELIEFLTVNVWS